jgi:hypothetical protein
MMIKIPASGPSRRRYGIVALIVLAIAGAAAYLVTRNRNASTCSELADWQVYW